MTLRPSDLIASALKLKPEPGLPAWEKAPTHCSHCAAVIATGDPHSFAKAGAFFSDTRDLANTGGVICWCCIHLRSKVLLNQLSFTLVTADAVYPIAKHVSKAWMFLEPPEPPFVVMHSSATMMHLSWRSRVTLDKNLIYVRYGPRLLTVMPAKLRKALALASEVTERNEGKWCAPLFFNHDLPAETTAFLNPKAVALMTEEEIHFLLNLSAGDRWALSGLMHSKLPQPEMPVPVTTKILELLEK